jgi:hypothetical protein
MMALPEQVEPMEQQAPAGRTELVAPVERKELAEPDHR